VDLLHCLGRGPVTGLITTDADVAQGRACWQLAEPLLCRCPALTGPLPLRLDPDRFLPHSSTKREPNKFGRVGAGQSGAGWWRQGCWMQALCAIATDEDLKAVGLQPSQDENMRAHWRRRILTMRRCATHHRMHR